MRSHHSDVSKLDPHMSQDHKHPAQQYMQNGKLPQIPIYSTSEAQQLQQNPQLHSHTQQYAQSSCRQAEQLLGLLNHAHPAPFERKNDTENTVSQDSVHIPVQAQHTSQSEYHQTTHSGKENVPHDPWHLLLGVAPTDHVSILYWSRTVNDWVDKKLEKCRLGQLEQGFHISLAAISFMHYRADPTQSEAFFEKLERICSEEATATVPQGHRHQAPALNASAATFTTTPQKTKKKADATLVLKSQDKVFIATAPVFTPALQCQTQDKPPKQTTRAAHSKPMIEPPYYSLIPSYAAKERMPNKKYSSRVENDQPPPHRQAAAAPQDISHKTHTADEGPKDNAPQLATPALKIHPKPADLQGKLRLALESSDSFEHLQKMWFQRARGQNTKDDHATRSLDGNDEVAK